MAKYYFDDDADLATIAGEAIAIIGYGNQGRSQALNLRDSGLTVIVGSPSDSSGSQAVDDGFTVYPIAKAVSQADILFLLVPDEVLPAVFSKNIAPHLKPDMLLNFAHGYNIHYKQIQPPSNVDVIMIGPRMIGRGVRETFLRGHGFPSLVAVHQDATGRAKARMLALAKGIGTTRMGAIESSFQEETEIDLFSEQSADIHIPRLMFEALTEAGFDPDVALLEIYASGELSGALGGSSRLGPLAPAQAAFAHQPVRATDYREAVAGFRRSKDPISQCHQSHPQRQVSVGVGGRRSRWLSQFGGGDG